MTSSDVPLLVVVTGPPGAGKTTIARELASRLGLPVYTKDALKETLFDLLGTGDRAWSRQLGMSVFRLLFLVMARDLAAGRSLVVEANFEAGRAETLFATLPPHRLVQVHCSAPPELLLERYRTRERHPGHLDGQIEAEVAEAIRRGRHGPLDLAGTLIELDTSAPVEVAAVAERVLA